MAAQSSAGDTNAANDSDQDFDPSAEMLVNDFDDEHTLEDEEANEDPTKISNEIMDLQKEGEMPLEDLLALYGYQQKGPSTVTKVTSTSNSSVPNAPASTPSTKDSGSTVCVDSLAANTSQESQPSHTATRSSRQLEEMPLDWSLPQSSNSSFSTNAHLMISLDQEDEGFELDEEDEEDEEEGSEIGDDWRRTIQVGSDYQAYIPDGLSKYGDVPPYENEDKMLWDPTMLAEEKIVYYLRQIDQLDALECIDPLSPNSELRKGLDERSEGSVNSAGNTFSAVSSTTIRKDLSECDLATSCDSRELVRDDETALFTLHQCGYNVEEALRRRKMQQCSTLYEPMTPWSEEECSNFEEGLRLFGKDFHQIQRDKIPTRSVSELVQFYYLWKKTERHDMYASKWRIEKKKYSLHPGTTDYMDRFLDEQETLALQFNPIGTTYSTSQSCGRQQLHGTFSIIQYNPGMHNLLNSSSKDPHLEALNVSQVSCSTKNNVIGERISSKGVEITCVNDSVFACDNTSVNGTSRESVNSSNNDVNPSKITPSSDYFFSSLNESSLSSNIQGRTGSANAPPAASNV